MRRSARPTGMGCDWSRASKSRRPGARRPFMCWACGSIPPRPSCAARCRHRGICGGARMRKMCARLDETAVCRAPNCWPPCESNPGVPTRAHLADGHGGRRPRRERRCGIPQVPGQGQGRAHVAPNGPRSTRWSAGFAPPAVSPPSPIRPATRCRPARAASCSPISSAAGGTALEVVTGGNGAQHIETCAALAAKLRLPGRSVRIFTIRNCLESLGPLP